MKNFPDSETWIRLHGAKPDTFPNIVTLTECVKTQFKLITVKGTNAHLTFFCRTYFDPSSRRLVTKSHQSQSSQPVVRPISWTSYYQFIRTAIYPSIHPPILPYRGLVSHSICQPVMKSVSQFFNQTDYQLRSILVSPLKRRVAIGSE